MTNAARLYGGSLYDLAAEENLTEAILTQLEALKDLFKENPDYIKLLSEPSLPKTERVGLIDTAFAGRIQPYLLNFLKLLCENGMLGGFTECCREYRRRYDRDNGIAQAVAVSAVALSPAQQAALKDKLEAISGKKVSLTLKIDPAVIGGLRVELEGQQFDGTAQGRITGLKKRIATEIIG